jgi:hypothetical protein
MDGKIIGGHPIKIKWGKKLTQSLTNSVSNIAYDMLPHVYVTIPDDQKIKMIIDRISMLINEVQFIYLIPIY